MKTYRYGEYSNVLGESWYVVEEKKWWGWKKFLDFCGTPKGKKKMVEIVEQMKNIGHLCVNVNI